MNQPVERSKYQWTRVRGVLLRATGAVFQGLSGIVAIGGFMAATQGGALGGVLLVLVIAPFSYGLNWVATKLGHQGRKLLARSADQLMAVDTRNPVLYLRSFVADEAAAQVDYVQAVGGLRFGTTTHEERLRNTLNRIGPVVALAEPGEELPDLGAARIRAESSSWMSTVAELFAQATLVVMRAGSTAGLRWELEYVLKHTSPERFVLLIPGDDEYEKFRAWSTNLLPVALPELPQEEPAKKRKQPQRPVVDLTRIVRFGPDWQPQVEKIALLDAALKPVFERLGIEPKLPPVIVRAKMMSAAVLTVGIFGAIGIVIGVLVFLDQYVM